MQHLMSKREILYGIRNFNVPERLSIITDIWDEIKESHELETVSEDERRILLNRLADYRANPDSATDWSELKQEIHSQYAEES